MRTERKVYCLKTCLSIFLWILWLVGAAICGLLLWLRLDFWTNEYIDLSPKFHHHLILIYVSLGVSAVITVFSVCGLIGGCLKIKWLLVIYLLTLVLAALLTISAVVYGTIYKYELKTTLTGDNLLKKIINSTYQGNRTDRITRVVNFMQTQLKCCGADDPSDYNQSSWQELTFNQSTTPGYEGLVPVPATCCKDYFLQHHHDHACYIPQNNETTNANIWQTGCKEKLQQFLNKYILVIIGIPATFFILQIICIITCSAYIHMLKSLNVPHPDELVYDMAHNQEKSPYPSRGDYREFYK